MGGARVVVVGVDAAEVGAAVRAAGLCTDAEIHLAIDADAAEQIVGEMPPVRAVVIAVESHDFVALAFIRDLFDRTPATPVVAVVRDVAAGVLANDAHPGAALVRMPAFSAALTKGLARADSEPPAQRTSETRLRPGRRARGTP